MKIMMQDEDGNQAPVEFHDDMPKAQIKAVMREQGWREATPAATAQPSGEPSAAPDQPAESPGWHLWEAARDEAIDPFLQGAKEAAGILTGNPRETLAMVDRIRQGGVKSEALRQVGNVGGLVTPVLAPESTVASVAAHAAARRAGFTRGGAQNAGTIAGVVAPGVRTLWAGRNIPGQLARIEEEGVGAYRNAKDAASARIQGVVDEATNRGVTLDPQQRLDLATTVDNLHPTRNKLPTIDRMEEHLLDTNQPFTFADLDRYHTELREQAKLAPTFSQAQNQEVSRAIRSAQTDALAPHPDLQGDWTDTLGQYGREVVPSRDLIGRVARHRTTFETRATSPQFVAQERGGLGVPEVNERLRQARRIIEAQRGARFTLAGPLTGAAIGGSGAIAGGKRDPLDILMTAGAGAGLEELVRRGRISAATPAGQEILLHYLAAGPRAVQSLQTPVQPGVLDQLIAGNTGR